MTRTTPKRVLLANPWWHEDIVNGIVRHAARHHWHLDLRTVFSGQLPEGWRGDGIVTMLGGDSSAFDRLLRQSGCSAVSLNANMPQIKIPRVTQDDHLAGRMAAEHFLERGFTSCTFFYSGATRRTARRRYAAFARRLIEGGGSVGLLRHETDPGDLHGGGWPERQTWLREKLRELPKPHGLFAMNDQVAAEVLETCIAESIAVPDEVAVLGMLNMAIFRHSTTIALSSIAADFDKITGIACDLLARMMDGEPPPPEPIVIPPTGIAVRRSTDTIAAHTPAVAKAIRFILDHYAEPIGIREITAGSGACKTLLYEAFEEDLGETPGAVLTRVRLDKARQMLTGTGMKIHAISEACGFGDPVNLYRNFKRHVGQSPAAYRRGGLNNQ